MKQLIHNNGNVCLEKKNAKGLEKGKLPNPQLNTFSLTIIKDNGIIKRKTCNAENAFNNDITKSIGANWYERLQIQIFHSFRK